MKTFLFAASCTLLLSPACAAPVDAPPRIENDAEFVDLAGIDGVALDLRYASTNNFTGKNLYGNFNRAFLRKLAADKLRLAANHLQQLKPGYRLLVLDAARPRSVQQTLWAQVQGSSLQRYVANPQKGSIHNYGLAVDLTIRDASGKALDMGTEFDAFTPLSQPALEDKFVREGKLSDSQLANRKLLRSVMQQAGFIQLPLEWWHFDALPSAAVHSQFTIIE